MSGTPYIRFFGDDWLAGTQELTLEERGALVTIVALTASTGQPVEYDLNRLSRRLGTTKGKAEKVIKSLIDLGKISIEGGKVCNEMLDRWVEDARKAEKRPWVPLAVQRFVHNRDGGVCRYCGCTEGPFHLDHVYPWALGGEHTPDNLTISCARCNWSKGSKTIAEWRGF